MAILIETEKAMTRTMRGFKLIEKIRNLELMSLLGLEKMLDALASRSNGHVLTKIMMMC